MRSFKQKYFKSKIIGWSSTKVRLHTFAHNGITHTFDGYDFKVDGIIVDYLKPLGYHNIERHDVFEVISSVTKRSGIFAGTKNYMGYCSTKNSYYTFDKEQIEFI
jgi:hypothetical protein